MSFLHLLSAQLCSVVHKCTTTCSFVEKTASAVACSFVEKTASAVACSFVQKTASAVACSFVEKTASAVACSFVEKTASAVDEGSDTSVNRLVFVHDWTNTVYCM